MKIISNYISEYVPKFPLALLFDLYNPNCMSCANSMIGDFALDTPCGRCYQTIITSDSEIFEGPTWTCPINKAVEYIMRKEAKENVNSD